jgi:putative transposase
MKDDTILEFANPVGISPDPLTDILRKGARDLLAQAVEAEVCDLMAQHAHLTDAAGRQRVVRHGQPPAPSGCGIGRGRDV